MLQCNINGEGGENKAVSAEFCARRGNFRKKGGETTGPPGGFPDGPSFKAISGKAISGGRRAFGGRGAVRDQTE